MNAESPICRLRAVRLARIPFLLVQLATVGAFFTLAVPAHAAGCGSLPREQDQVWLVNDRNIGCERLEEQVARLSYWRYDREQSWVNASLEELLATDDSNVTTVVFVHGNRIAYDEASVRGWSAYSALVQSSDERPIRFIMWSWPSERVPGPLNDARVKAWRTNPSGYHLAWFLDQIDPQVPVGLWAHSFGARIVTGALHLLGGGSIDGHPLENRAHAARDAMPVVLVVAALDNDWLVPGHGHGQALSQVSRMLLLNNSCDILLQRYHRIDGRRSCQQALGYTGLPAGWLPAGEASKISQMNACCYVGRRHAFDGYVAWPDLNARVREVLISTVAADTPEPLAEKDVDTQSSTGVLTN